MARIARVLIAVAALVILTIAWSSTEQAAVRAAGLCNCVGAGQVFIGSTQVGGSQWDNWYWAQSNVDCAANYCQGLALAVGRQLCTSYGADTYTTQWWWWYPNGSPSSGYLSQQYACSDL